MTLHRGLASDCRLTVFPMLVCLCAAVGALARGAVARAMCHDKWLIKKSEVIMASDFFIEMVCKVGLCLLAPVFLALANV